MNALNVIYGLTDPRDGQLRYVGKSTTGAKQRVASHLCPSSLKAITRKNGWLKGLLAKGLRPEFFVIEECDSKEALNEAEVHQIASLRAIGCELYNMTPGGDGLGVPCSPEKRAKISAATKGRRLSVRSVESYANSKRGWKRSALAIEATRAARLGYKATPETLAKSSASQLARWADPAYVAKMSRAHGGRPFVDQYGTRYESEGQAAKALNTVPGCIHRVLKGTRKHTKGFTFTYVEN